MDAGLATVIAAVVAGPVVALLVRNDKRNTQQHGQSMAVLKEMKSDVKDMRVDVQHISKRLDNHIDTHNSK